LDEEQLRKRLRHLPVLVPGKLWKVQVEAIEALERSAARLLGGGALANGRGRDIRPRLPAVRQFGGLLRVNRAFLELSRRTDRLVLVAH
jgi:hypothetical protein